MLLGNLNYQVENGGFLQWHSNGYSSQINRLKNVLQKMGTQSAKTVSQILRQTEISIEDDETLREYDDRYYAISEQFMQDAEQFLANYPD